MRVAKAVDLSAVDDRQLRFGAKGVEARVALRANIVLLASKGFTDLEIGARLSIGQRTAARWRARYLAADLPGIQKDAPRLGRTPCIDAQWVQEIVRVTVQECPLNVTHWSTRSLARQMNTSEASVRRNWHRHGLKSHRVRTFKLSRDKPLLRNSKTSWACNPPENAIVLSCDEKEPNSGLESHPAWVAN